MVATLVAACGTTPATPGVSPPDASLGSAPSSPASATANPIGPPSGSPAASAPGVAVDPTLLSRVPAAIAGIPLTYDPVTTATVAADPTLGHEASGLAMAIAVAPASSTSTDLAIVSVIRLRDASASEAWFRAYRDSYDAASCATAGGVSGNAQATMHDRTVFIGSCAGGAFTYHVWLPDGPLIVSATSVGPLRLGEKVMESIP